MLLVIIPTSMSEAESVPDDKEFTIPWLANACLCQMLFFDSGGLPERFNPVLRSATTSYRRLQVDYILEPGHRLGLT